MQFVSWLASEVLPTSDPKLELCLCGSRRTFRDSNSYNQRLSVAVALKFTVRVVHKGTQKIWSDFNKAF